MSKVYISITPRQYTKKIEYMVNTHNKRYKKK